MQTNNIFSDPHQDQTNAIYNDGAMEYKTNTEKFEHPNEMFEYFIEQVPGKTILDVGCAYGRDVARLRKKGFDAIGIDLSQGLLDVAENDISDYLQLGDMTQLDTYFLNRKFDGIIASCSIVHLEKKLGHKVIKDVYNLLNQNGIFYISVKTAVEGKNITLIKESKSLPGVNKKYSYFSREEIESLLENTGFQILKKHFSEGMKDVWGTYICKK